MAVERKGFFCYNSWLRAIQPYADAERGRIFTALLNYSSTGQTAELGGNERFLLPSLYDQIDRDTEKAARISKTQRANQAKPRTTSPNSPKDQNQNPDQDKAQDQTQANPPEPPGGGTKTRRRASDTEALLDSFTQDPTLRGLLAEWMEIRRKRRAPDTRAAVAANLDALPRMAADSGLSLQDYLREVIRRGWQAFYPIPAAPGPKPERREFDWLTGS